MRKRSIKFTPEEDMLILKCVAENSHNISYGLDQLLESGKIKNRTKRGLEYRWRKIRNTKQCFVLLGSKYGTVNRKNIWRKKGTEDLINTKQAIKNFKRIFELYC